MLSLIPGSCSALLPEPSEDRLVYAWVVLAGVLLGLGSRAVDLIGLRWVGNIAALWVMAAFVMGRRTNRNTDGAVAGALCLVAATAAYYAWRAAIDGDISNSYLSSVGVFWLLTGAVIGGLSGALGARSRDSSGYWGVPAGVSLGEAGAVMLLSQRWLQVALQIALGVLFLVFSRAEIRRGAALSAITATVVLAVAVAYRPVLH